MAAGETYTRYGEYEVWYRQKRFLHTSSPSKPSIWLYDIINSSSLGSPFITKTDCANKLGINRATI